MTFCYRMVSLLTSFVYSELELRAYFRARIAMSTIDVCRLCRSNIITKNSVALFSNAGIQNKLADRITDLLGVRVVSGDGLPQQICKKCKRRIETLERATKDLVAFRDQAAANYNQLAVSRGSLKRTKVTSGDVCVSPGTASARPPSKKLSARRLDFGSSVQGTLIVCLST